jgi:hypothetical protein
MTDTDRSRRASAIVLLGIFLYLGGIVATRWQPHTFLFRDGSFYAQTNRSIAEGATLRQEAVQPKSWYDGSLPWLRTVDDAWSNLSMGQDGEWFPKHSYLMPVASTPLYLIFGPAGLLLFNVLAMGLGFFAAYRLGARAVGELPATVAVFGVMTSPIVPHLAYAYSHDVFYGALVAGGAATLVAGRHRTAGLLMGLAVFAKATNIVLVVPMALLLFRGDRRAFLRMTVAGAIPLAVYAVANWAMYGAPWIAGYNRILIVKNGVQEVVSYSDAFDTGLVPGLLRYFQPSAEGEVWQMAAVAVIAFAGLVPLAFASWRLAAALAVGASLFAVVFALYHYGGGRFALPLVMLAVVPGAALVDALARGLRALGDGWDAILRARRAAWVLGILIGAPVIGIGAAWVVQGSGGHSGATMAADVERLVVTSDEAPCDYFNMSRQKWECSGIDRDDPFFTGSALGAQCAFADHPVLRVPPGTAKRTRALLWRPSTGGNRLVLSFGLDTGSRGGPIRFTVLVAGVPTFEGTASVVGKMERAEVTVPIGPGLPVVVRVQPTTADGALCLDATVLE